MLFSENRPRGVATALLLTTVWAAFPSFAWAHGEPPLSQPPGTPAVEAFSLLFLSLLAPLWFAFRRSARRFRRPLSQPLAGGPLAWLVVALLGLYVVALPPHLVHHVGDPLNPPCIVFIQGNFSDQGAVEHPIVLTEPAFAGEVPRPPSPSVLSYLAPLTCGRSPPDLSI